MTLYGNAKARSNGDVVDENEERACGYHMSYLVVMNLGWACIDANNS